MPQRLAMVGDHVCRWISYEETALAPDQVRFRTIYASGKYGTWAAVAEGSTFAGRSFDQGTRLFVEGDTPLAAPPSEANPIAFGTTAVGIVTELGSAVKNFKVGDKVIAMRGDIRESNS